MAENYFYSKRTKTIHIYGYCNTKTHGILYPSLKKAMEASENTATMCKKCLEHKEKILAENARIKNEIKQAELAKKRELKERKKLEEEKKKIQEEEQRIRAEAWEKHMQKRKTVRAVAWTFVAIGIVTFLIGIANGCQSGKDTSNWLFVIMGGFFSMWIGGFTLRMNPDNGQTGPLQKPVKASRADQVMLYKVQAIQNMPPEMRSEMLARASAEYSADLNSEWQAKKTKEAMIKGAIVGGIVGGDAGAVVGAMIGKEKSQKS